MDEKMIRKQLRSSMGRSGWALLVYYLIVNVCVVVALMVDMAIRSVNAQLPMDERLDALIMGNGWGYILASVIGLLLLFIWKGKKFCFSTLWKTEKRMIAREFAILSVLFLGAQGVFQIIAYGMELLFNQIGLSVLDAIDLASGVPDTVSMFLYVGLIAPIVEEILFRGLLLRLMRPYGKLFAIVTTAFLFGMFHGNPVQSPYAFLVGLVLGFVAIEYSIGWAMVLHMGNNLILGDTLSRVSQLLPQGVGDGVFAVLIWGCLIAGVVILIRKKANISAYCAENRIHPWCTKAFFTSVSVICFTVLMVLSMLAGITVIE